MTSPNLPDTDTLAQDPADNFIGYVRKRIAYNRTRAATTEYVADRAHALSEIRRYKALIGGVV